LNIHYYASCSFIEHRLIKIKNIEFNKKFIAVAMEEKFNHSEIELEILRKIEENPNLTQRQIAKYLGLSLGKTNYLIKALLDKGLLKINNFRRSDNKLGYLYLLTPEGAEKKRNLTILFFKRTSEEFDKLKKEMEHLQNT